MRFSSTAGVIRSDQVRGVHGLGIKLLDVTRVLGVPAERCLGGDASDTQDFLLVTHKEFPFKDVKDYLKQGMLLAGLLVRLSDWQLKLLIGALRVAQPVLGLLGVPLPLPMVIWWLPPNVPMVSVLL